MLATRDTFQSVTWLKYNNGCKQQRWWKGNTHYLESSNDSVRSNKVSRVVFQHRGALPPWGYVVVSRALWCLGYFSPSPVDNK